MNFNILLIITIFFGIVSLLFVKKKAKKQNSVSKYILSFLLAAISGIFIYTVLPETYDIYKYVPWVVGVGVFVGVMRINE